MTNPAAGRCRVQRRLWIAGLLAFALASVAAEPAPLRWGGDATGGEPYIIGVGDVPGGFEGELAQHLAKKLGRKSQFVQGDWANLPQMLRRDSIDCVLN